MLSEGTAYTPTPAVSHAILRYNSGRKVGLADGIVITPSHNPPDDGGFKYDPPHAGPADSHVTSWIESRANEFLIGNLEGVKRIPYPQALRGSTSHRYDYLHAYAGDLENVIDLAVIRESKITLGVDPLGGAGIDYWPFIAERYGLNLTVVNKTIDPTFRFMTMDWDGKIRMDPSSPYAMQRLIGLKDKFDIAFASDTDHDRHGIVTRGSGLLPPNHYLSACIHYLFSNRKDWRQDVAVGKTLVSSSMIDRVVRCTRFRWGLSGSSKAFCLVGSASQAKRAPAVHFLAATPVCGPPIRTGSFPACSPPKSPRVWERIPVNSIVNSLVT
jgi:phosphoglucomutase